MRELKSESQIQPDRGEPNVKSPRSSQLKEDSLKETSADLDRAEADRSSLADLTKDPPVQETATRKRRASTSKTVAKTKQPTPLKAKQTASTQIKLTWEPTQPSIVERFQHLEQELRQLKTQADQINQQSIEIQSEMQELRTIAHTAHPQAQTEATVKQSSLPSESSQSAELNIPPFLRDRRTAKTQLAAVTTLLESSDRLAERSVAQPPIASVNPLETPPRFSTAPRPKTVVAPRRRTLRYYWKRLQPRLDLPKTRRAIAVDALIWTSVAAGLRIGLTLLAKSLPFLNMPLFLLLFCPATLAGYLAFCVPNSKPVVIYRLLLLTLGLLIGGNL